MSTFVYAPGIKVYVDSYKLGKILDLSDDLTNAGMQRRSDGVSQFQFGLMNTRRKYDNVFTPNDRIVVVMKRLTWMRTFTGYLNQVPIFSSWPRDISMTASCSLKRLQYFFWDPNLKASQMLVRESFRESADGGSSDGGSKQAIINLLEDVVDWSGAAASNNPKLGGSKIHIGAIPKHWFDFAAKVANSVADNVQAEAILAEQLLASIGGNAASIGGRTITGESTVPASAYGSVSLNAKQAAWATQVIAAVIAAGHGATEAEIAIGCCLQESNLLMYANSRLKESLAIPHDAVGKDHLSVGLFQQQAGPNFSWGTVAECMDVVHSTNKFLEVLTKIHGYQTLPFTVAIQKVQRSKYPQAYAKWEQPAKAIVKAYTDGLSSPTLTNSVPAGPYTPPSTKGAFNTVSAQSFVKVAQDLVAANPNISYRLGGDSPYNTPSPTVLDCSSFTQWVYFHALGVLNDMPRSASAIYDWAVSHGGKAIPVAEGRAAPGALIFVSSNGQSSGIHHMEISLGGKRSIGAHSQRSTPQVGETTSGPNYFNLAVLPPNVTFDGTFTQAPATGVATSSVGVTTSGGTDISAALDDQIQKDKTITGVDIASGKVQGLFGNQAWLNLAVGDDGVANILTGIRAISNDQVILPYIQNLCNAAMRSFCSAPNGDFMAWFPDYYGIWKTAAKMVLQPIEVKDFTVDWSDEYMVTHQFVQGAMEVGNIQVDLTSGQFNALQTVVRSVSHGVATIESPGIMAALFGLDQTAIQTERFTKFIFERFGPRPSFTTIPNIVAGSTGNAEFFMALYLFMQNWAAQYNANIDITFMPELYPGMILQLPEYNFQAYVNTVSHSVRFGPGGGYSTQVNIMAPSRIKDTGDGDRLLGLPIAGANGNLLQHSRVYEAPASSPATKPTAQQTATNARLDRLS